MRIFHVQRYQGGVEGYSFAYAGHLNENEMNIWRIGFFPLSKPGILE